MSCLALELLAAEAAGEAVLDAGARVHAAGCGRCAAVLADQRAIRALAQALPRPALTGTQRAALAAEVLARAEIADPAFDQVLDHVPRRRVRFAIAALAGAAVVIVALAALRGGPAAELPSVALEHELPAIRVDVPVVQRAAAPLAALRTTDAELTRDTSPVRDVVTLRAGELAVDALDTRPVEVVAGTTRVAVRHARARVIARGGVIEHVAVFAGSVEVVATGTRHVIEAGATWDRLGRVPVPAPAPPVSPATAALAAFRAGWTALRAGDHAAAIAAFDRATDPVVAEDASYWAAVAAERAGDLAEARRRFAEFVARFGASPRVEAARAAKVRLGAPR